MPQIGLGSVNALGVGYAVQNGAENCEEQGYATEHQPEIANASDEI